MKTSILLISTALMMSGCSKTWSGIQQDTTALMDNTVEIIHEATAPTNTIDNSTSFKQNLPRVGDTVKVDATTGEPEAVRSE